MNEFFEKIGDKLKTYDDARRLRFEIILGVAFGIAIELTLFLLSDEKGILSYLFLLVFVISMVVSSRISQATGWVMSKYRIALVITLSVGILIFLIIGLTTGTLSNFFMQ